MHNFILNQFEQFASRQFPGLFNRFCRRQEEACAGSLTAEYVMAPAIDYQDLIDELRDNSLLIYLYNYRPSDDVDLGRRICFYSSPKSTPLFKVNATTNQRGAFASIIVTIYDDAEKMRCDVVSDYENISKCRGVFKGRNFKDVQLDFM